MKNGTGFDQENCIVAICDFARRYRQDKGSSARRIYEGTGYARYHTSIVQEQIIERLRTQSDLVDEWLMFSEDRRCTPAWMLQQQSDKTWRVGHVNEDGSIVHEVMFEDSINACALMIRMEMEAFRLEDQK